MPTPPPDTIILPIVQKALEEDLAQGGDLTSNALIAPDQMAKAVIVARQDGRIAGLNCARLTFAQLDANLVFAKRLHDGDDAKAGDVVASLKGPARAILAGERVALNFLGHLSGIATSTRAMVAKLEGTDARLCCTRKTLPGLRSLQKYAVRVGGGVNHRFGLGDAILIKDNHIHAAGGIENAITRARQHTGHMTKIEIEVDTLDQLHEALPHRPDVIMLDNMDLRTLRQAVDVIGEHAISEASGGVTIDTIADIAATGVDVISTSAITMSARALDLGLDFTS
ncbi:MAG: carboxylating nicotinate-nucleotide diphosphorylase [Robiginitomaculum sp.]|nr:carboxylating nicotinate-nucleotide diphosphorylase [Robiginitomaculum sp.]MDQ7078280.1 carboxylating nicotinate-nucleotide diphosphorylase [Robiginitomaculum sp.]